MDMETITYAEKTFKCTSRSSKVAPIESQCMISYQQSIVTFAVSHTVFEKFDVKQFNDLEICPRSLTVVLPESCCVAMYAKCSEDSERMKRKSPFSTTPLTSHLTPPLQRTPANICRTLYCQKLRSLGYIFVADSMWVALQIFEQFCPKAGDASTSVAKPETDFNAKLLLKVIQGHLFRYH